MICGLSGGVDSAVAAVLIHEAIGDQLTCVFVDHGLLRLGEAREGRGAVPRPLQHSARACGCAETCFSARSPASATRRRSARPSAGCSSTCSSAKKRRRSAAREFLAQGTLYPDVIESVSFTGGPSVTIKSHHNVGGLPERMNMKLVEPLRELFKDEVRALGRELGLPDVFVGRHPFPGPGPRDPLPGRDHAREARHPAPRRRDLHRGNPPRRALRRHLAGLRGAAAGEDRRRDGRRPHLRFRRAACAPCTSTDGMTADFYPFDMKLHRPRRDAHHQRGEGRQPRGLRRDQQAAGDDRVGVSMAQSTSPSTASRIATR